MASVSIRGAHVGGEFVESTDFIVGSLVLGYERRFGPGMARAPVRPDAVAGLPGAERSRPFADPARMRERASRTWRIAGGVGQLAAYFGALLLLDLVAGCPFDDGDGTRCDPMNYAIAGTSLISIGLTTTALAKFRSNRLEVRAAAREAARLRRASPAPPAPEPAAAEGAAAIAPAAESAPAEIPSAAAPRAR